jgi:hypothetical protein
LEIEAKALYGEGDLPSLWKQRLKECFESGNSSVPTR